MSLTEQAGVSNLTSEEMEKVIDGDPETISRVLARSFGLDTELTLLLVSFVKKD